MVTVSAGRFDSLRSLKAKSNSIDYEHIYFIQYARLWMRIPMKGGANGTS